MIEKKVKIDLISFKKCKMLNKMRSADLDPDDTTYRRHVGLIISAITDFLVGPFDSIF